MGKLMIFKLDGAKLREISKSDFGSEKELHILVAKNLDEIFGLEFIKSEVALEDVRFDILAYDQQAQSFVVIELKNVVNLSVIDQGIAYLSVLIDRKADIIEIWYDAKGQRLDKNKIRWDQSRVIFISPEYSSHQKLLPSFKDLPIELWEAKRYGNDIFSFVQIEKSEKTTLLTKIATKSSIAKKVASEIKVYNEDYHLNKIKEDNVKNAYYKLKESLLSSDLTINIQKYYISFKKGKNIAFFGGFHRKKFEIVVMLPYEKGRDFVKHHNLKNLSAGIQKFYGNDCFAIDVVNNQNMDEIVNVIKAASNK